MILVKCFCQLPNLYNTKELSCFIAFCFYVVDVWNEVQFFVKCKSNVFMLVYKWDIFFFDIKCWIVVQFSLVTETDAFCFSF